MDKWTCKLRLKRARADGHGHIVHSGCGINVLDTSHCEAKASHKALFTRAKHVDLYFINSIEILFKLSELLIYGMKTIRLDITLASMQRYRSMNNECISSYIHPSSVESSSSSNSAMRCVAMSMAMQIQFFPLDKEGEGQNGRLRVRLTLVLSIDWMFSNGPLAKLCSHTRCHQ